MGKCIFKSSTCSRVSLLFALVTISDVSRSWYPPSTLHDVRVQPPTAADFPSSNAPSPTYSAVQRDRRPASDKEQAVNLQWRTVSCALSHPRAADCRANRWYRDARGWHTIL